MGLMFVGDITCGEGEAMTAAQSEELVTTEVDVVVSWRFEELLRAGCDAVSALILAGHHEVDLHQATSLLEHGCPPALAVQIMV
jgi:hypothetical protein